MIYWPEYNKRPNVQHLSDEEKRRRFLLEQEEYDSWNRQMKSQQQMAILIEPEIIEESNIIIEDDMAIIAKKLNINLKDIAPNVLDWETGKTAANTAPTNIVVTMAAADTYADDTTAFELQLNSNQIFNAAVAGIQTKIQTMNDSKTLVFVPDGSTDSLYSNTGDWALPVTQGTLNDFRVNVYIYGVSI